MKNFILKLLLFSLPLLMLLILYVIIDPFKVIYKYSEQINTNKDYQITENRDFQSTQLFLWNYNKYDYNSFILGNSRSMFYQVKTWNKFIKGNSFHFNASSETIYGINGKLKLMDELNVNIKNVLIILDESTLSGTKNSTGHLFIKHPAISNESYLFFHIEMLKGFFSKSMFAYIDLFFRGEKKKYMAGTITNNVWKHDMKSNQLSYYIYDKEIKNNPKSYYSDKHELFDKRDTIQKFSEPSINRDQEVLLKSIYSILESHKTNYKIIINPLYDQIKINPKDLIYLRNLFGIENVFDFSGINSITNDYHNYYETSHYRPRVCDSILNIIYSQRNSTWR